MIKRLLFIGTIFFIGIVLGCINATHFTPSTDKTFTSRSTEIKLFIDVPQQPYEEIGLVQSEFDSSVFTPIEGTANLKMKAKEVGADAVIHFTCNPGSGWGPGYCQGTAIRFTE
jgi:hypothetical protein